MAKKKSTALIRREHFNGPKAILIGLVFGLVGGFALRSLYAAPSTTGNGAPSGPHYNLNVIGVSQTKTGDFSGGGRIFVPLVGNCKIALSMGDFSVLDGNCTDGQAAFQLPNPDPNSTGTFTYSVWARPLGKPGGSATAKTCATDPTTLEQLCSTDSLVSIRNTGKSTFVNASKDLLTINVVLPGDTNPTRLSLFDSRLQDYFWNYDNNGLKLLQLRFYPQS
ncbi:MAG TPA: hypothetical protein VLE51_00160 [Candidatus Saccharimonadales bacterium]|nr:hypothetical protein [Candidatus Saccharimonadales bacterium]